MNMNKLISTSFLVCCLLVSACGGSGGSDATSTSIANKAPIITLAQTETVASGNSVMLSADVSDPEGDPLNFSWQSDNQKISFSTINETSTLVTFPDTDVDMEIKITFIAADDKANSTQKNITITLQAEVTSNDGPLITMPSQQQAQGGDSIVLVASVQDPQGDGVTIEWHSENSDIVFSDNNSVTPTLTLPDVSTRLTTILTLVAIDSQQNQSEKSLTLTIVPNDGEVTPTVNFELSDRFDTLSGNVTTLTAKITSNIDISEILWDLSTLNVEDSSVINTTTNNMTTSTMTFTAPTVSQLTKFSVKLGVTTSGNIDFNKSSKVYVSPTNTGTLNVTLPNSITVNENSSTSITPTIESSQIIDSFQWQWLSDQELTLLTSTNKVLSLSVPNVDENIKGQLSLTVTMGELSQTVVTELTIENDTNTSEINLTASRLVAVKGQKININVLTDNFSQITDWSWDVSGAQGTGIIESKNGLEITASETNGQQFMTIKYFAKLVDNTEILRVVNITLLSEVSAKSSFSYDNNTEIEIYKGIEKVFTSTFTDPHGLVDTISLNQQFTFTDFDKAELTRNGDQITFTFKTTDVATDYLDFIHLAVFFGDYEQRYPVNLRVKVN